MKPCKWIVKLVLSCLLMIPAITLNAAELVYVPVEPCRLLDTRATIGAIDANTTESFVAYGNAGVLDSQGGNAAGCPNPKPGSTPVSIAANITAVGNQASGNGNLVAYPYGSTVPSSSLVNYRVGTNIANSSIIALCEDTSCLFDFNLQSNFASVPAIVDVQGYFYPKTMKNVITVSAENADFTNPIDAINSIPTTGPDAPSVTNPYLIQIGPGAYDLGSNQLVMREWVDIKGTGSREATILAGSVSSGVWDTDAALVLGENNSELTDLTIINNGGGNYSIGIYNYAGAPKMRRVKVRVSGGVVNVGIDNEAAAPTGFISNVNVGASGGSESYGIFNENMDANMQNVTANAQNGAQNAGIYNYFSSPTMRDVKARATGGNDCAGIVNDNATVVMNSVIAEASGCSGSTAGVYNDVNSSAIIRHSTLEGVVGLYNEPTGSATVSSSTVIGGAAGTTANNTCFYVDDSTNLLDANCLPFP